LTQIIPAPQVVPQLPQFIRSLSRSTQTGGAPQGVRPAPHTVEQTAPEQTCPGAQPTPQPPQFIGSTSVSTQASPQRVVPPAQ
jgi:hypothetical protein